MWSSTCTCMHTESTQFNIEVLHMDVGAINISWNHNPQLATSENVEQTYHLTISYRSRHQVITLNETHYYFRAPNNAPPCDIYNFSVTATPVGATYTGDGCSAPSPVLSTTVPSLPRTDGLESSLVYSLEMVSGELTLNISFEVNF